MTTYPRDEDLPRRDDEVLGDRDDRTVGEKVGDAASEFAGNVKQKWGDMTDDERLQAEGAAQEREAEANRTAGKLGDDPLTR